MTGSGDSVNSQPTCFISYSHDSPDHKQRVLDLAEYLRRNGVVVMIDRYVESNPPKSWQIWMDNQIQNSDFVIVVATKNYDDRMHNRVAPGVGQGARWEGGIIMLGSYEESGETTRFIPVVFSPDDSRFIPSMLRATSRYSVNNEDERTSLLRRIHGAPEITPGPVGDSPFSAGGQTAVRSRDASANADDDSGDREARIAELSVRIDTAPPREAARIALEIGELRLADDLYTYALTAFRRVLETPAADEDVKARAAQNYKDAYSRMAERFGENGPIQAVYNWIGLIQSNNFHDAWKRVDPKLRLVLAQAWLYANRQRPEVKPHDPESAARELAQPRSSHPLTGAFIETQLREFHESYGKVDAQDWGAAERPRRFGIDLELIILMKTDNEPFEWSHGSVAPSMPFILRWITGNWYIAGFSTDLPVPGWPPTRRPLPLEGIEFRKDGPK